jgi:D-aspartate ligase
MSGHPIHAVVLGDLNLTRCLARQRIPVSIVASDPREPTLHSRSAPRRFLIAPPTDPEHAVADLEAVASHFADRPVLYFGTDAALLMISRARARLAKHFRFALSEEKLVESLVDKALFADLAAEYGLLVPESVRSGDLSGAAELLARIDLPCAFKPSVHTGWLRRRAPVDRMPRKALRADTPEQAMALYDELSRIGPFVVQRWIEGGEDSVLSFHCYADEQSRVVGWFVGKKIRTYPREAGVSTYLELVHDQEVADRGFEVVSRLGVVGPLKIDFKRDRARGALYVLELNARFTLWCYLGMASGVNLPAIAHAHLSGQAVPRQRSYDTDVRWLSFGNDLRTFLRSYRPSGELGFLDWLRSYRSKKVYDVFSWTDPGPSVVAMFDYAKQVAARVMGRRPSEVS